MRYFGPEQPKRDPDTEGIELPFDGMRVIDFIDSLHYLEENFFADPELKEIVIPGFDYIITLEWLNIQLTAAQAAKEMEEMCVLIIGEVGYTWIASVLEINFSGDKR